MVLPVTYKRHYTWLDLITHLHFKIRYRWHNLVSFLFNVCHMEICKKKTITISYLSSMFTDRIYNSENKIQQPLKMYINRNANWCKLLLDWDGWCEIGVLYVKWIIMDLNILNLKINDIIFKYLKEKIHICFVR